MATKNKSELRQAVESLSPFFRKAAWFSLISSLLVLAPSAYMLEVYDRVLNSRNHYTLLMLTILVLGAYVVMELLEWARGELMHEAGEALDGKLSNRIFGAIFEANLRRMPGGQLQAMTDLRTIREFFNSPALLACMELPVSVVFLALLFAVNPLLGWAAIAGSVIQTMITWLTERGTQPPLAAASQSAIAAQQYADGSLRNAEVIESMGMLRDIHRRWIARQRDFLGLQAVASMRSGGYQASSKFVQNVMSSMMLGLAAWLLLRNELNGGSGMMIVASVLGARVLAPLVQIVTQWRAVVNVREAWARVEALLGMLPPRPATMALPEPKGFLQAESVVAGAPGTQVAILKGLAFNLAPGDVLAVLGPSASGKTTLARVLVGLWPCASGKVRLDGADVFTWDKAELGPHVGYLPQGVELFDGTLAENISRFGDASPAKVEAAARTVGLHEFIMSLPQGYQTEVGRDGGVLSGGQRQRVALARAVYGDPVFVVLDEPNSSLDDAGDAALAAAIIEMKGRGTTFVVMTHRASVLGVANKLLMMRDGALQMFGPRDEVVAAMQQAAKAAQQQAAAAPANPPGATANLPAA